jgi:hypothetical protein
MSPLGWNQINPLEATVLEKLRLTLSLQHNKSECSRRQGTLTLWDKKKWHWSLSIRTIARILQSLNSFILR